MRKNIFVQALVIAFVVLVVFIVVFAATAYATTAHWRMDENRGTVLRDSAHNHDGMIGRKVITNGAVHRFTKAPRNTYVPGRIDLVPDSDVLDPGNDPFAVTVTFTWPEGSDNNLIQKGQGSPAGGLFKMKTTVRGMDPPQPPGHIKCLFRGSTGDSQVESYSGPRLDDGKWHTVTCRRTSIGTVMAVDGKQVDSNGNDPGVISNDWPIAIGGNSSCADGVVLECNYWHGRIGDIKWDVRR